MKAECRDLTDAEMPEQHRLYMSTMRAPSGKPVAVGGLLFCRVHRRALIECHDERNTRP